MDSPLWSSSVHLAVPSMAQRPMQVRWVVHTALGEALVGLPLEVGVPEGREGTEDEGWLD